MRPNGPDRPANRSLIQFLIHLQSRRKREGIGGEYFKKGKICFADAKKKRERKEENILL